MEFISREAEKREKITYELGDFIDDNTQPKEEVSFYRERDPNNIKDYPKFHGQIRDPIEAIQEENIPFYGHKDQQPELYAPEDREHVSFDKFEGFEKSVEKFKKTLRNFKDSENQLFDAVIYGVMFNKCNGEQFAKEKIIDVLGENFFNDLKEIEGEVKLDRTLFGYFDRCFKLNEVLAKYNYFLKFFERRDVYRFLVKKKAQGKITRNLSSSVLEKFNGYEVIRNSLSSKEREEFVPINVVYESIYDENVPVPCYFTNEIHLAYRSYIGKLDKGNERMTHRTVRQCCYCQNFFSKTEESLKIHMSTCGAREGITYAFENTQILNYQDNLKYLSDLPFTVYFNFETTGGSCIFFDPAMYVASYCQIYSFHPSLNFDKTEIFRSYQQTAEQIYDLSHFKNENIAFFNKTTFLSIKRCCFCSSSS